MSLDPAPSDAELLRRLADRERLRLERDVNRIQRNTRQFERDVKALGGGHQAAVEEVLGGGRGYVPEKRHRNAPKRGAMNKTEAAYADRLELQKQGGSIQDWKYGSLSLRLAKRTWYRPDFLVTVSALHEAGLVQLRIDEVKGHWEDDARAKFKIAAELYPMFVFRAVRRVRGEFQIIETLND